MKTTVDLILAIDLGKYKSFACLYDARGGEAITATIESTRAALARLIEGQPSGSG